jgi:hypothetical protein
MRDENLRYLALVVSGLLAGLALLFGLLYRAIEHPLPF